LNIVDLIFSKNNRCRSVAKGARTWPSSIERGRGKRGAAQPLSAEYFCRFASLWPSSLSSTTFSRFPQYVCLHSFSISWDAIPIPTLTSRRQLGPIWKLSAIWILQPCPAVIFYACGLDRRTLIHPREPTPGRNGIPTRRISDYCIVSKAENCKK
jgi:hypothetical protein